MPCGAAAPAKPQLRAAARLWPRPCHTTPLHGLVAARLGGRLPGGDDALMAQAGPRLRGLVRQHLSHAVRATAQAVQRAQLQLELPASDAPSISPAFRRGLLVGYMEVLQLQHCGDDRQLQQLPEAERLNLLGRATADIRALLGLPG